MVSLKFSRFSRLDTDGFTKAFADGEFYRGKFFIVKYAANGLPNPRLGTVLAKKKCAKATWRNKYRRQIKESFRLNQHKLPNTDIVIVAKDNIKEAKPYELRQHLEKLWEKLSS